MIVGKINKNVKRYQKRKGKKQLPFLRSVTADYQHEEVCVQTKLLEETILREAFINLKLP